MGDGVGESFPTVPESRGITVTKRKVTDYACNVCKTTYQSKKRALNCSRLPIEEKTFELGDVVQWREPRTCGVGNKNYVAEGKITKIVLESPDEEYIVKWLGSAIDTHKWRITFKFRCPHCSRIEEMQAYQEELIKVK